MRKYTLFVLAALIVLGAISCSKSEKSYDGAARLAPMMAPAPAEPMRKAMDESASMGKAAPGAMQNTAGLAQAAEIKPAAANRKLIRTGSMNVQVKNLLDARKQLTQDAQGLGGFVSGSSLNHYGDRVSASVTLRVPAEKFEDLVDKCRKLGEVMSENMNVEDVTDQYVDLDARLKNAYRLEERYLDILKNKTAKLGDLLEVERELARVRETIEVMEAQKRGFDDRISLSTLTVTIEELLPSTIKAPESVWGPAAHVFTNLHIYIERSMALIAKAVAAAVVIVIYLLPWVVIATIFIWIVAKLRKRRKARKAKTQ